MPSSFTGLGLPVLGFLDRDPAVVQNMKAQQAMLAAQH
jgi:hypothetical protein